MGGVGVWLVAALLGCAPQPVEVTAAAVDGGVQVVGNQPLERVVLYDETGATVATRRLPAPTSVVHLIAEHAPGARHRAVGWVADRPGEAWLTYPVLGPLRVEVEAPLGQGRVGVSDGETVSLELIGDGAVELGVVLTATEPVDASISIEGVEVPMPFEVVGQRAVVRHRVGRASSVAVEVRAGDWRVAFDVDVRRVDVAQARRDLELVESVLPVSATGARDRARPPDRVVLPARWWMRALRALHLGYRPRDDQVPWCWQTITLHNRRAEPADVVVRVQVLDLAGEPAQAFRSRLREADGGTAGVTALLRVPPGERATATLPLFVDGSLLPAHTQVSRVVEVTPLGSTQALHRLERPLYVTRGSRWASGGFVAALVASALGFALLVRRGPRWLRALGTADLVTIALFGSLTFVVGAAFQVVGMGVGSILGPFAPLLMGLPDDAFRACLLGTLVLLIPRPGVVALATTVGFLMRGLALGSFHPVDLLYLGSAVFWLESGLWLAGLTRSPQWRDQSRLARWVRMSLGFGLANAAATATGLLSAVVLYRLYFAAWYVALILALPGFLYVVAGCWLAVDFGAALRRVQS